MPNPATVLIVEDEPLVRLNAAEMVEDAGWKAVEAANANEAMELIEAKIPIDVLFTDINMPGGMDGLELASAVHQLRPTVELVITSGKRYLDEIVLPDNGTFLPKPYGFDDLIRTIERKLHQRH